MAVIWVAILIIITFSIIAKCIFAPKLVNFMLYAGTRLKYQKVGRLQSYEHESIRLTTSDGVQVHAIFMPTTFSKGSNLVPTILHLHGNASNLSNIREEVVEFLKFANVMAVDYRGYGLSDKMPNPTESGLVLDAYAALDYLSEKIGIDHDQVFVSGNSLGGAVAIGLMEKVFCDSHLKNPNIKVKGVILENTFTSLKNVIKTSVFNCDHWARSLNFVSENICLKRALHLALYSFFSCLFSIIPIFLPNNWVSIDRIKRFYRHSGTRILFLSGEKDTLVPPSQMDQLYRQCNLLPENKFIVKFENGAHNNTWRQPNFFETIEHFVNL